MIHLVKPSTDCSVYKYWLLMRGIVENYCPRGEIQPWPTIHQGPSQENLNDQPLGFKTEDFPIEGFAVTSYPANFASHHTRDRHVGFLFPQSGIVKHNKMSQNFSFSSYQNTKLQVSDKNISTHTWVKFKSCYEVNQIACFVVFLHTLLYKRKPNGIAKSCAYRCVSRRANPLYSAITSAYSY